MNIRTVVGGVALFAAGIAVGYFCLGGARVSTGEAAAKRSLERVVRAPYNHYRTFARRCLI